MSQIRDKYKLQPLRLFAIGKLSKRHLRCLRHIACAMHLPCSTHTCPEPSHTAGNTMLSARTVDAPAPPRVIQASCEAPEVVHGQEAQEVAGLACPGQQAPHLLHPAPAPMGALGGIGMQLHVGVQECAVRLCLGWEVMCSVAPACAA